MERVLTCWWPGSEGWSRWRWSRRSAAARRWKCTVRSWRWSGRREGGWATWRRPAVARLGCLDNWRRSGHRRWLDFARRTRHIRTLHTNGRTYIHSPHHLHRITASAAQHPQHGVPRYWRLIIYANVLYWYIHHSSSSSLATAVSRTIYQTFCTAPDAAHIAFITLYRR